MKSDTVEFPTTLQGAITYFADPARGLEFMASLRWANGNVCCPHCQAETVSFISTRSKWKCMKCHKQFSAKVGTIFEDSALGYDKWFPAMWMICNAKNGISSYELHRAIGVTQKTAWFMLQRIRLAMQNGSIEKLKGTVEADETYIGGKAINMHASRNKRRGKGTGGIGKAVVMGLLERDGKVITRHIPTNRKHIVQGEIRDKVEAGANVYTDSLLSYKGLQDKYVHEVVDHMVEYVRGQVHTNSVENFWSLLKRTLKGTYVSVDPVHLFRYLDEQTFRFNERKGNDAMRFLKTAVSIVGRRLTWLALTDGKGGEDLPLGTAGAW